MASMSMTAAFATAVSGLQANAERFSVAASNVVNANSTDFKARLASSTSQVPNGVSTSVSPSDQTVDVAREFIGMIEAQIGYSSNAEVIETTRQMTGTLLDVVA